MITVSLFYFLPFNFIFNPMLKLQLLMDAQASWSNKTFGSLQSNPVILRRLQQEVSELIDACHSPDDPASVLPAVLEEFADCMLLFLDAADKFGITASDLLVASRIKLNINKQRNWSLPDNNGFIEHIPDN